MTDEQHIIIKEAMDIHTKRMAVAFKEWKGHEYIEGIFAQKGMWFDQRGECVAETTEELYDIFTKEILNDRPKQSNTHLSKG